MNAFKMNMNGSISNGSDASGNYSTRAVFSSTIKYLQLPLNLTNTILGYLLFDKTNKTIVLKDDVDGQFYYYATCDKTKYSSIWFRLDDFWFEILPRTFIL